MKKNICVAGLCIIYFTLKFAYADQASVLEVTPPTITISAEYQAEKFYPFTFQNIEKNTLEKQVSSRDPAYFLSETPAITMYSDSGSYQGYTYIRLRGIDQTRLNFSLDGVPLNEPEDQGVYFSNYPDFLGFVDRVQIQRGVGSSKNGTASYGGSLLFDSADLGKTKSKSLGVGVGSFGTLTTYGEINSGIEDRFGSYLRASVIHSDGYKDRSKNESQSIFFKTGYFGEGDSWILSGFVGHQANQLAWIGSTLQEIEENPKSNSNGDEDDQFLQSLTHVQNIHNIDKNQLLRTSLYYNYLVGDYDFDLNNFLTLPSTEELYNYRFESHLIGGFSNYNWKNDTYSFTLGMHANTYKREHLGSERSLGTLYKNHGQKSELSGFGKMDATFGNFLFLLDLQSRYTSFEYQGVNKLDALDWMFFNPKTGITYLLDSGEEVYYSIGRTGREPTRNDILLGNDDLILGENGEALIGTTVPEYVVDHELGIRTESDTRTLNANLYYMDFKNEIVLNGQFGPNGLPLTQGVDESYRTGVEIDLSWKLLSYVKYGANTSYNYSRIKESGENFEPVISPNWIINQKIEYATDNWNFGAKCRYQSSSFVDFANTSPLDNFFVVDLSIHRSFQNIVIGVFANNLFNEKYFTNGYVDLNNDSRYFVQAPMNLYTSIVWTY